jgi:hypothetical protein
MEECGHVLMQFIKSDSMNSEEYKTECPQKKSHNLWTLKYQVLAGFGNMDHLLIIHWSFTNKKMDNNGYVASL